MLAISSSTALRLPTGQSWLGRSSSPSSSTVVPLSLAGADTGVAEPPLPCCAVLVWPSPACSNVEWSQSGKVPGAGVASLVDAPEANGRSGEDGDEGEEGEEGGSEERAVRNGVVRGMRPRAVDAEGKLIAKKMVGERCVATWVEEVLDERRRQ